MPRVEADVAEDRFVVPDRSVQARIAVGEGIEWTVAGARLFGQHAVFHLIRHDQIVGGQRIAYRSSLAAYEHEVERQVVEIDVDAGTAQVWEDGFLDRGPDAEQCFVFGLGPVFGPVKIVESQVDNVFERFGRGVPALGIVVGIAPQRDVGVGRVILRKVGRTVEQRTGGHQQHFGFQRQSGTFVRAAEITSEHSVAGGVFASQRFEQFGSVFAFADDEIEDGFERVPLRIDLGIVHRQNLGDERHAAEGSQQF